MNKHNVDIALIASSIPEGANIREVCPFCGGGASAERSLSVTRTDDGYVYQCFRAKCGLKGRKGEGGGTEPSAIQSVKRRRVWEGKTYEIPDDVRRRIYEQWGMEPHEDWWWTTDYGGRIAMSIRSPKFTHRGWVLRSITGSQPKALTYIDEGQEGMSWYKTVPTAPTVVVEDIPSAVRASAHVNAVSLLGTGVGMDRAMEIADHAPRPILMALDQDATALSFRWARKYSLLWGDVKVLLLKKDIKDMKEEDICRMFT